MYCSEAAALNTDGWAVAFCRVAAATAVTRSRTGTSVVPCSDRQFWMNLRHWNARWTTWIIESTEWPVSSPTRLS